jgi:hypothetical protein
MNLLASSPWLAYGLVAVVALLIVLLHLLRPRPLHRAVASTLLWQAALRQRSKYHTPWRRLLSLLLCLLAGLSLALALGRPEGFAPNQSRVVVVLDNSPTMATRTGDGQSRWLHAVETARRLIESVGVDVMLVDTMGHGPHTGFVRPAQALEALEQFQLINHGPARAPVLPESGVFDLHVISDGVADLRIPPDAIMHSVFEPAVNVAVTGLQTRPMPGDPLRVEAFVQVYNASNMQLPVRLSLRGADGFALAQDLLMNAGELVDVSFDISAFAQGVLAAAAIAQGDAFSADDIAYAMVAPHRLRNVLLVTAGNARLEDAIRSLPGVRLKVMAPQVWRDNEAADLYLFDRFAPARLPDGGSLLLSPEAVPWLAASTRNVRQPAIVQWLRGHQVLDGVDWPNFRAEQASVMVDLPQDARAWVQTAEGALISASAGSPRWMIAGFAPEESNLSLQAGMTIFLGNALRWLAQTEQVVSVGLGPIRVPLAPAQVVDGSGRTVPSQTLGPETMFDAQRPDVYTVLAERTSWRVVANVLDPRDADINATRFDASQRGGVLRAAVHARIEPWTALVSIALLFLLIEWAAWTRRVAL